MAKVKFKKGKEANLPTAKDEGSIYFTTDTGKIFMDVSSSERKQLFRELKNKCEEIVVDTKNLLIDKDDHFYSKIVFDNLICEYKNFTSLLEGLERADKD